jgi:ribonuclease HII
LPRLERASLAMLGTHGGVPFSFVNLLTQLAPHTLADVRNCRWYGDADLPLPVAATPAGISLASNALTRDLSAGGITFLGAFSEPMIAAVYNRMVGNTRNKAVVLFSLTVRLIQRIADTYPGTPMRVVVDRQGGRQHYGQAIMRAYELPELRVLEETSTRSAYELKTRPADCTIEFVQKGEDRHLPIALASIFAKYQRELFMRLFNRFFQQHRPDLKPTAGYYTDGQRFLRDLGEDVDRLQIDRATLVRTS